jgi:hypothetical protein
MMMMMMDFAKLKRYMFGSYEALCTEAAEYKDRVVEHAGWDVV